MHSRTNALLTCFSSHSFRSRFFLLVCCSFFSCCCWFDSPFKFVRRQWLRRSGRLQSIRLLFLHISIDSLFILHATITTKKINKQEQQKTTAAYSNSDFNSSSCLEPFNSFNLPPCFFLFLWFCCFIFIVNWVEMFNEAVDAKYSKRFYFFSSYFFPSSRWSSCKLQRNKENKILFFSESLRYAHMVRIISKTTKCVCKGNKLKKRSKKKIVEDICSNFVIDWNEKQTHTHSANETFKHC